MRITALTKSAAAAGAVALALGGVACGDSDSSLENTAADPGREANADATGRTGHEGATLTLTGCLQESSAGLTGSYILTQVNEPSSAVGTSGSSGAAVEREQMRAAKHAYQLESDNDDQLEKLVGKQVRVTGTLDEVSDLNRSASAREQGRDMGSAAAPRDDRGNATDRPRNTTERPADSDRADADRRGGQDIDAGDLAKVNVTSVVQVADACGAGAAR